MKKVRCIGTDSIDVLLENGEVMKGTPVRRFEKIGNEPKFVKMYIEDLCKLTDIDGADMKVLIHLMSYMDYNNIVDTTVRVKKEIAAKLGITSYRTLNNALVRLKKANLILSTSHSTYTINPELFTKQDWSKTKELITTVTYSDKGKTIKTVAKYRDDIEPNKDFDNE